MKMINSYEEIIASFAKMNGKFDLDLYREYADAISPTLFDKVWDDCQDYDFDAEVVPVMENAMRKLDKLNEINDSFQQMVDVNLARVIQIANVQFPVQIILYLGLCNGAGWATMLDGKPAVLLGVEKMIELDWCDANSIGSLVYHELGHIWHAEIGTMNQAASGTTEEYLSQLYQEGVAMYFELLCVGDYASWSASKGDWWQWCLNHEEEIAREYLRRLNAGESCQDFFGDWCSYMGQSNLGYFLGYRLIDHLSKKYTMLELANLTLESVADKFSAYVGSKF